MVISPIVLYVEEVPDGVHTYLEDMKATPHQWSGHLMVGFPRRKERVTYSWLAFNTMFKSSLLDVSTQFILNGLIGGGNKYECSTLKGFSVAKRRIKSGTQKLPITFSEKLGGPIGPNVHAFIDEVVMFTRKSAPVIGVRSWKDIKKNKKDSIATVILVHTMTFMLLIILNL
jgi:hypothetical protein